MSPLVSFFVYGQALGALAGAFAAVWSELSFIRAMRDGKLDAAERAHLRVIGNGLRFGMSLLLLSSLGLVVEAYLLQTPLQPALTASYWTFIALALLIIVLSWALARRRLSFSIGTAALFTAWWFLVYLTFGWLPILSFGTAVALYVVLTGIFYAVFHYARLLSLRKK